MSDEKEIKETSKGSLLNPVGDEIMANHLQVFLFNIG